MAQQNGKKFFEKRYASIGAELTNINLKQCIRINTLKKINIIERLQKQGVTLEKINYLENSYNIKKSKFSLGATTEFLLGYYSIQSAPAQLPVTVLNPLHEETILDMCASPGNKTTQIAEQMKNKGTLIAFELKEHRIPALIHNLERCGITNTTVFRGDSTNATKLGIQFDKILLDAPCSGNYVTDKNWFEKRTLEGIKKSSRIQKRLLKAATQLLKKNGILVYSTCTIDPLENEMNINWAIQNLPLKIDEINLNIGDNGLTQAFNEQLSPELKKCKRFFPHKTQTEAFFIARLKKC